MFAYNILRIDILVGDSSEVMTEAMNDFGDVSYAFVWDKHFGKEEEKRKRNF